MAGGSMRHNALCASLIEVLRAQLRGRCVVLTSDQRVVAARRDCYVYPDISVVCGRRRDLRGGSRVAWRSWVRVIDWSELKPGLGPHDLAYCLHMAPTADRPARDRALLRRY
jgi:hypothetical protein